MKASLVAVAVTMARIRIKLVHELPDESAEGARRRAFEEFVTPAVAEREHVDVDVISSCEQTAADARAHRREAPQETENW